ncbi:MAG TPA: family 20 glycosylhydrolase, partial [Prevotella sp.]
LAVKKGKGTIRLALTTNSNTGYYELTTNKKGICITGASYKGVINGIATLRQLLPADIEVKKNINGVAWIVPYISIKDQPRFEWRGLELDVSRHFFTKNEIKEFLDVMALYKLNKFHWHLTDDQGWRIEIKKYPLLTQNGGWRTFNTQDEDCMKKAKQWDNPTLNLPADRMTVKNDKLVYGGYYTQDDIREVVAYATQRGIDVIPEIDMPGHSECAIKNYEGLSCFKKTTWRTFSSPMCPGKDRMLEFCKDVYKEVFDLFPYEYVHIGGDEVDMTDWKACPDCQKRMLDNGLKNEHELQAWFIKFMEKYFNEHGKKMIGWDEILEGGASPTSTIMWWRSWASDALTKSISNGNEVICTPNTAFYLDYAEDATSLSKIYDFRNIPGLQTEEQESKVKGVQGNIWTEVIPTRERMYFMTYPRAIAIAELGWSAKSTMDFEDFNARLLEQFKRLQKLNIPYRTPGLQGFYDVNVFTDKTAVNVTCTDADAVIRYTTDGSMPTEQSPLFKKGMTIDKSVDFTFRTFDYAGRKGETFPTKFLKENYAPAMDVASSKPGLTVAWHDYAGELCAEIENAPFKANYVTPEVMIPEGVKGNIGLIFTGYIRVPENGIYTFKLLSDDGSLLYLDGNLTLDNDGGHSPKEKIAQHAMRKGLHPIMVKYFDHNGGQLHMEVLDASGRRLNTTDLFVHD